MAGIPSVLIVTYPVFATQGGGYARLLDDKFIFVVAPSTNMGLNVGDEVPEEWGLEPVNKAAQDLTKEALETAAGRWEEND